MVSVLSRLTKASASALKADSLSEILNVISPGLNDLAVDSVKFTRAKGLS
jgi:hypothetical protein